MNGQKKVLLFWAFFFFCFSVFSQESPRISESGSETPNGRLRNIAESLEELERSETVSREDLTRLQENLTALEASLSASETALAGLRTQVSGALEYYEKLSLQYGKQQRSLKIWKGVSIGSGGFSAVLLVLLILL
jgi:septal ring factor EnvC (AmiA/AmiB activator)